MSDPLKSNDAPKKEKKVKLTQNTELSEEDKEIKEKFDLLVERLQDKNEQIQLNALEQI